jgi:hypothetical protein
MRGPQDLDLNDAEPSFFGNHFEQTISRFSTQYEDAAEAERAARRVPIFKDQHLLEPVAIEVRTQRFDQVLAHDPLPSACCSRCS